MCILTIALDYISTFITTSLAALIFGAPSVPPTKAAPAADVAAVITHGNQHAAGTLKDGVLHLELRAGAGLWRPEKESGPALEIDAFGEQDGPLVAPAPLIRVPEGTEIIANVSNNLTSTLHVHGLCEHTGTGSDNGDSCATIDIPASSARRVRFRSGRSGTYGWWASTSSDLTFDQRYGRDSQLSGAFIVDPPTPTPAAATAATADRVFVITAWSSLTHAQLREAFATDDPFAAAMKFNPKFTMLINGLSWPDTERLTYRVGDAVRWRFVNATGDSHPLHLHGFYFDVDTLGDGFHDTAFDAAHKRHVVTQLVPGGGTLSLTWRPDRAGNWLFHCHNMDHVSPDRRLGGGPSGDAHGNTHADAHHTLAAGMAGMVLGVTVFDDGGTKAETICSEDQDVGGGPRAAAASMSPASTSTATTAFPAAREPRRLTLTMQSQPQSPQSPQQPQSQPKPQSASATIVATVAAAAPAYGFVLSEPATATTTAFAAPGPTLVLRREEPVEITLVNQLPEATAIHWHGMELDSYYDGVHGFGGMPGIQSTPLIAPGESFTVRFTPPRTGTFIYHTHMHDDRQLTSGLYGALVVTDPTEAAYDPNTDHTLVIGREGSGPRTTMVLNGSRSPHFHWRPATRHRLRLINITRADIVQLSLVAQASTPTWRPLTKDGAAVPPADATPRAATQVIAVGETYDFEYTTPTAPQDVWVEVKDMNGLWRVQGKVTLK